jgi:diacylglycerol kinase family enzyme
MPREDDPMSRAAVVVNPTKIGDRDQFRATVHQAMAEHGWDEPLWLETTSDDPGQGQARSAVAAGADLVLACGGDGTVTACAEGVADSGVPLGILPLGTGNLLARNVGLPADLDGALAVALGDGEQKLDTGTANGQAFVVMAGLGLDAQMLSDTSEPLKKRLGWAAYALSVLRHLNDRPIRLTLAADQERPVRLRASTVIIGNVGWLRGGVPLLPDARPDDGLLDAVVLTARGWPAWAVLAARVVLRREPGDRVRRYQFRELRLRLRRPQPWELDGEVMAAASELVVTARPGRLRLRMPRDRE